MTDWVVSPGMDGGGGGEGDTWHDSAEVIFQSFLREATVSISDTEKDVHSLTLPIQLHGFAFFFFFSLRERLAHLNSVVLIPDQFKRSRSSYSRLACFVTC